MGESEKKVLPLLRGFEGLRLKPEAVEPGVYEVGYGHRTKNGAEITAEAAEALLLGDVAIAERAVDSAVVVPLGENQRAALVSLVYNIGGDAFARSTLVKRLNAGRVVEAGQEFARWIYFRGEISAGLVGRRKVEADLFMRSDLEWLSKTGVSDGGGVPFLKSAEAGASAPGALSWVAARIREPSTWRGIGGLLAAAGLVSAGSVEALIAVGMSLASAVEVVRKERAAP